jgi:capsular exopolysaccharide synthesis family protein
MVLTSAAPNEGKTTVASNLAIAIAEITGSVLLVDGDLRKPHLQNILDVGDQRGLSDILTSSGPVDMAMIEKLVQPTSVPGLSFLPSGTAQQRVSSAFYSRNLPQFLRLARTRFDTILIDSPPVLVTPEARLLGRFADGVILVIRADQTTRGLALEARRRLAEDSVVVLGAILNNWRRHPMPQYGYYC